MGQTREPIFQPLVAGRPRLLRTLRVPAPGVRSTARCAALVLTLEAGLLCLEPTAEGELTAALRPPTHEPPEAAAPADEEDPWWRLLGAPLTGAWALSSTTGALAGVALQFREDRSNPRIVSITLDGSDLCIGTSDKATWSASGAVGR